MIPFLALASDGTATFDTGSPTSANQWIGSQRYGDGVVFGTLDAIAGTDVRNYSGLRFTSEGVIRLYDATSSVPASATIISGCAITEDGQLCISTGATDSATTYIGGMAVRNDGAVHVTGISVSDDILLESGDFLLLESGDKLLLESSP